MSQASIGWTANQTQWTLDQYRRDVMVVGLGTVHVKAYTDTAAAIDNAINAQVVMVWASTDCHVVFGDSPTATTNHTPLTAKTTYFLLVPTPGTSKMSAIQQANNGTLYVTECL